jgi:hypothetical protein
MKSRIKIEFVLFVVGCLFVAFFTSCSPNFLLKRKMLEKYSDDQNYVTLIGEIVDCDDNDIKIKFKDKNDIYNYYIYSEQPLDLVVGSEIEFVTVQFHFYNGHKLPIVELKLNGETLLTFEEGKKNLIDWVNETFGKGVF